MNKQSANLHTRLWSCLRSLLPISLVLLIFLQGWSAPKPASGAEAHTIFLPMVNKPRAGSTPPPPPQPGKGAFFLNRQVKNNSADIAVDTRGGMHTVYEYFVPDEEKPPAVYAYCPGPATACANPANWRSVQLGEHVSEVQLALTPAGQPRLLMKSTSTIYNGGIDYSYASCDQSCANPAGWTITRIVSSWGTSIQDVNDQRMPQRNFALDPQGRPRFLYQDRNYFYAEPDHIGLYYVTCDEFCDDASNWTEVEISRELNQPYRFDNEIFDYPALTFTKDGAPRIAANVFALNQDGSDAPDGLYYLACDSGCGNISGWQRVFLLPPGSGSYPAPSWDLELDANDRPRIALFTGGGLSPDAFNYQLLYLYCNGNCLDSNDWQFNKVGLPRSSGQSADLELDMQGRPRLAWISDIGDLGYAWCNVACESAQPQWRQQIVETESALRQENPQAIPPNCDHDVWEGLAPALALDPSGQPRMAYDASVEARCYYDETPNDPTDPPTIHFEPVWRGVHVAFFPQP